VLARPWLWLLVAAPLALGCPSGEDDDDAGDDDAGDDDTGDDDAGDDDTGDDDVAPFDPGCDTPMPVTTAEELHEALAVAAPGTAIELAPGEYAGEFHVEVDGEEGAWICIRGPADLTASLDGNDKVGAWHGILTLEGRHHVLVENLEIHDATYERYGVLVGAPDHGEDGCHDIRLRNLHVFNVGEEIIKIQGYRTHDIVVEDCEVHTNGDWSGIDVQGHWGGTPPFADRPQRVLIQRNLIYDIGGFAGVGNEVANQIHVRDNVVLGSAMGLDIGCGNHNLVHNNLVTSYEHFNELLADPTYDHIDLSGYAPFTPDEIAAFDDPSCLDGIALSGNYMSLVFDNEVVDCNRWGDLYLSYDHWVDGEMHNVDEANGIEYGHRKNLVFRNRFHHNVAWYTIHEYDKQDGGVSHTQAYFRNVFFGNETEHGLRFERSEGLLWFNNTVTGGDGLSLNEQSTDALIKNTLFFDSGVSLSKDSTGADQEHNHQTIDTDLFVDFAGEDLRLDPVGGTPCIDTGADLSSTLAPLLQPFHDAYDTEYAWYPGFDVAFDFDVDLAGQAQDPAWDIGAYVATP